MKRTSSSKMLAAGVVGLASVLAVACGGSSNSSPTAPSPGGGTIAATITITSAGVSAARVDVQPGQQVMFVNSDTVSHEPTSNPHGTHTDCPALGSVGLLAPGQSRATGPFTDVKACGFHDHLNPTNSRMQGQIVVGNAAPVPGPGY